MHMNSMAIIGANIIHCRGSLINEKKRVACAYEQMGHTCKPNFLYNPQNQLGPYTAP